MTAEENHGNVGAIDGNISAPLVFNFTADVDRYVLNLGNEIPDQFLPKKKKQAALKTLDKMKEQQENQSAVESVAWTSNSLPDDILGPLNEALDELSRNEPADFHPGSNSVVRDLVHPSMYCYVKGKSVVRGVPGNPLSETSQPVKTAGGLAKKFDSPELQFRKIFIKAGLVPPESLFFDKKNYQFESNGEWFDYEACVDRGDGLPAGYISGPGLKEGYLKWLGKTDAKIELGLDRDGCDFWGRDHEPSDYQWLPSEFSVTSGGLVKIDSYINNLDAVKYPEVYKLLAKLFEKILPMFDAVCGNLRNSFYGDPIYVKDCPIWYCEHKKEPGCVVRANRRRSKAFDKIPKSILLRGRSLQVITKIVEYRVKQEANFDGVWHVEGMPHENIIATGLCIIKRDENFAGAEMEFRRFLLQHEGEDMSIPQNTFVPLEVQGNGHVRPLGKLETPAGRVIVFPNSHIHRLSEMYSTDGADAVRRIIVFWLVNPERPILSTANVDQQQAVMRHEEALHNRLALMRERKFHKEDYSRREINFCEH